MSCYVNKLTPLLQLSQFRQPLFCFFLGDIMCRSYSGRYSRYKDCKVQYKCNKLIVKSLEVAFVFSRPKSVSQESQLQQSFKSKVNDMKYYAQFEKPKRVIVLEEWDLRDLVYKYGPFRTYSILFTIKPEEQSYT